MEKKPLEILFGKRNFFEFLESLDSMTPEKGVSSIREVLLKDSISSEEKRRISSLLPSHTKIKTLSLKELDRIAMDKNHQGYVILRQRQKQLTALNWEQFKENVGPGEGPILILDRIQDPGNLGNLIRTAECLGVKHIVLSDRDTAPISPVVEKSSAGAIHHVHIYRFANLNSAIERLKEKEYWILATDEEGTEEVWDDLPSAEQIAIIMGNEGEGIKRILLESADYIARIPLYGSISSLNVVVACGITLDRVCSRG
ncbi:tRNA (guanosine-2'-O-)-methyltransferase [Leptospira ryugenii]|uniref:tRNA (Guanosine-2'-O-)-methyltransferase n=1 Tax=Leptospira ryugenii TaxID=1917863 RepID=A0A2P2DWV2_9LEPT|nr:23S rRNA (guanosine(2251)-2'-O)-methyltransferase RlmB [Leptospira ryugenii]GBF49114.1 tRNA (guanosine-2'-O-)-methyltransferase [Leptospira ryugenii]